MKHPRLWLALAVLIAAAAAFFFTRPAAQSPPGGRRPMPVMAAAARRGDIGVTIDGLGTVTAWNTVTVKPRVAGQLVRVVAHEGQLVKVGEVLAEIDPRPFQVLLDQADGQLLRDQALYDNAKRDLARYRGLLAEDSIASQQVDAQAALVRQMLGTVAMDRAQVANARLQLSFTRITAPISGRIGLRLVDPGNAVSTADPTGIFVITQTQPIAVVFAIPAGDLPAVLQRLRTGATLPVEAYDREDTKALATGDLSTVDNQIDVATGTVKLKAKFANPGNRLFPNQFVNARLLVETLHGATLVPTAAIQRGTPGTFVYVVNRDQTVSVRAVALGPSANAVVAVEKGLAPGERVVTDGADKLRQGEKVEVVSAAAREDLLQGPPQAKNGKGSRPGAAHGKGA